MGFWSGRLTFTRYHVSGPTGPLGEEIIDQVRAYGIERLDARGDDGVAVGWSGGDHILDTTIDYAKNVVEDTLHLGIRIDTDKIPSSLIKAYTQMELEALVAQNPGGVPTKTQRAEAKENALAKLEAEAQDGRFARKSNTPLLWDAREGVLYAGTTTSSVLDRIVTLFRLTFGRTLEPMTVGWRARKLLDSRGIEADANNLLEGGPLRIFESGTGEVAWSEENPSLLDSMGNELLVWIWRKVQQESEKVCLGDGSLATVMLTRTLLLDCPRGMTGRDQLTDLAPTKLPEAFRALQAGKLPRKAGLILHRENSLYELTLQAESLAVSNGSLPKPEGKLSADELRLFRLDGLRHLAQSLDLLVDAFLTQRLGPAWNDELGRIRAWMTAA